MAVHDVHELTGGELTTIRTRPQRTQLYMAVMPVMDAAVVYVMRVDGAPASNDNVVEVDYDRDGLGPGVGADFAACLSDMTVYVGTTSGSADIGVIRLREFEGGSDEDSGTMLIGEESEIEWADNLYLTVVDEFGLWPRHVYISDAGVIYMDYDVAYTDQHKYTDPVPVLGPDAVVWLTGASVDVDFDASSSWALDGGALTYAWTAPGASATAGMNTSVPVISYDVAGVHRAACAVTRTYGGGNDKTFTGYRYVFVFDNDNPPITLFNLESCSGDWDAGGWEFVVKMYGECDIADIVDRARVIVFARDWYGDTEVSIGPIVSDTHDTLRANTVVSGWIDGESIIYHNVMGYVEFTVYGPQHWFGKMSGFPHGIEDHDGDPTSWVEFDDLTLDKGLWSFIHWRSTATRCMDMQLTGDTRQLAVFDAAVGTLWDQLVRVVENTIVALACCDRYGRLFIEVPINLMFEADRGAIVTVIEPLKQDWIDAIEIERRSTNEYSMLDISGVHYLDGTATPFFSLSYGHIPARYGNVEHTDRLAMYATQVENNNWSGLILNTLNNEYPNVDIRMSGSYRVFDICPRARVDLSIVAGDTQRGIVWNSEHLHPKSMEFEHYPAHQMLFVASTMNMEIGDGIGVTGDPPIEPPPPPPPPPEVDLVIVMNDSQIAYTLTFFETDPVWIEVIGGLPDPMHQIYDFVFNADTGQTWMVSYAAGDLDACGLWYCQNLLDAAPAWALIMSVNELRADLAPGGTTAYFASMAYGNDGVVYCPVVYGNFPSNRSAYAYTTGAAVSTVLVSTASNSIARQSPYSAAPSGVGIVFSCRRSSFGVVNWIPGAVWGQSNPEGFQSGCNVISTTYVTGHSGIPSGMIYDNTDLTTIVYDVRCHENRPIVECSGHLGWINIANNCRLMLDAATVIAHPNDVFGPPTWAGVGPGGPFMFVDDDPDKIIWIAAVNVNTHLLTCWIGYTDDGGVTWSCKDGNWQAATAQWSGSYSGGNVRWFKV